jgi:hypothetical protein
VKGGNKGKSQGIEGSANANDMSVWIRPHIGFCTIEKCDLLPFFLSIESLPAACKFRPLFSILLLKHGASSYEVSPLLLFNLCSFFFFLLSFFSFFSLFLRILLLLGRDSTHWNFLGESFGK